MDNLVDLIRQVNNDQRDGDIIKMNPLDKNGEIFIEPISLFFGNTSDVRKIYSELWKR